MLSSIVYDIGHGHIAKRARAVAESVSRVTDHEAQPVLVSQEIFRELPASIAGIIYGPSTYNGTLSTKLKQFVGDANKTMCLDLRWRNKVAAGFTSSGTHGGETLDIFMTMTLFAVQDTMPWMDPGPEFDNDCKTEDPHELDRLGNRVDALAQSDMHGRRSRSNLAGQRAAHRHPFGAARRRDRPSACVKTRH